MVTADQLLCHGVGDYVIQSDWMAREKTRSSPVALFHAVTYAAPFLLLRPSWAAFTVIVSTHFAIDRFRLARFVVWAKNVLFDPGGPSLHRLRSGHPLSWDQCSKTGYPATCPDWLAVWLLIIADNLMHVAINGAALRWLP